MTSRRKKRRQVDKGREESRPERVEKQKFLISRREFLKGLAAAAATALAAGRLDALNLPEHAKIAVAQDLLGQATPDLSVSFVRPDDFVALKFDFYNFMLLSADTSTNPPTEAQLQPSLVASPTIVMHLPPQNIAEQAFFEAAPAQPNTAASFSYPPMSGTLTLTAADAGYEALPANSDEPLPGPGFVYAHLAGWSRLVFRYTRSQNIPYTLPDILHAISQCDLQVAPPAQSQNPSFSGSPPDPTVTAIESPYRLIISPHDKARWAHSLDPVDHGSSRTELWHTRLSVIGPILPCEPHVIGVDEVDAADINGLPRAVRAIWSPDLPSQAGAPTLSDGTTAPTHYVAPNSNPANGPPFFRTSLDNRDRDELVHLSSNYSLFQPPCPPPLPGLIPPRPTLYVPQPVSANRLMLTSLGSWMDLHGVWNYPTPQYLSIEEWRHITVMARDSYVKVVYAGHLMPFGHRAVLIKVTERKFTQSFVSNPFSLAQPIPTIVAYLKQRMFIVVREPEKSYPVTDGQGGQPWNGRRSPFKRIRITTLVTPNIDDPSTTQVEGLTLGQDAFWISVSHLPFQFHIVATDWDDNLVEFTLPMVFADTSVADKQASPPPPLGASYQDLVNGYNTDSNTWPFNIGLSYVDLRTSQMNGQKVAFVSSGNPPSGKTSHKTNSITWLAEYFDLNKIPPDETTSFASSIELIQCKLAPFYPSVESASVRISGVAQLSSTGTNSDSTDIQYYGDPNNNNKSNPLPGFLWNGLLGQAPLFPRPNNAQIFAKLASNASPVSLDLKSNTQKSGGLATPSISISGLSATLGGASGPLDDLAGGNFDPTVVFSDAKILGTIPLSKIITKLFGVLSSSFGDGKASPKITSKFQQDAGGAPTAFITNLHWEPTDPSSGKPAIQSYDPINGSNAQPPLFEANAKMVIDATITKPLSSGDPTYVIDGSIDQFEQNPDFAFAINLLPGGGDFALMKVPVKKMKFHAESGSKPDLSAVLGRVQFQGVLNFVNTLEDILASLGFDDPPSIDITPTGITVGYAISVPQIPIGSLVLGHLRLSAKLNLPFNGDPASLRFAINEREDPFTITYLCFGGGGHFEIVARIDDQITFDGTLEFGAYISLDLSVASGGAHASAGIEFGLEPVTPPPPNPPVPERGHIGGYCTIVGDLEVLGIASVRTEFLMSLKYDTGSNAVTGQASLTVEVNAPLTPGIHVTLGPITRTFGHSPAPPTFGDMMPSDGAWENYISRFVEGSP